MIPSWLAAIGSDRYLGLDEIDGVGPLGQHAPALEAWRHYQRLFGGYCESRLDPQFQRLRHPARHTGTLRVESAAALVVGTGPTLASNVGALCRVRAHLRILTSPRGSEALARYGVEPDVVLVEHRTALDAHHSARFHRDGASNVLARVPLVAAEWRTPAALLEGVDASRLFVPEPTPSWGVWPATLVAMAVAGGASRVGLLGVDLGSTACPDAAHEPLRQLLGVTARTAVVGTVDCGQAGARKPGWPVCTLDDLASAASGSLCAVGTRPAPSVDERRADARSTLVRLQPYVDRARRALALVRSGGDREAARMLDELLEWRSDAHVRVALQEGLSLSFLPRLWRSGVSPTLGEAARRPLRLACDELVGQAEALSEALSEASSEASSETLSEALPAR